MQIRRQSDTVNPTGSVEIVEATPTGTGRGDEKTPFENFESLATKLLRVPKEEADQQDPKRKRD